MPSPVRRPPGASAGRPPGLTPSPADGSALLRAVVQGKFRLTRLLLEGGSYINEGNAAGQTPLMAACRAGYPDPPEQPRMVRYLLENGADPNIPDKKGMTALMHACAERAGPEVVSVLLAYGADPSARDYSGSSALVYAINRDERATLRVLLEACQARGKEVIIITTDTSPSGTKTTRQYLNSPPSPASAPAKSSPGVCTSPSDVRLRTAGSPLGSEKEEERDVFCFPTPPPPPPPPSPPPPPPPISEPPRARGARPLKRLNSEPWGLAAPAAEVPRGIPERLVMGMEGLSLAGRPRRHSVESREAAGLPGLPGAAWAERAPALARRNPVPETPRGKQPPRREHGELEGSPRIPSPPSSPGRCQRRCAASAESSSPASSRRRPAAALAERRGSGTFPLEPAGRAGFLPPLHPGPYPPGLRGPGSPKGRRKLLRRHSMQTEEMRHLGNFQSGAAPEPGT